MIKLLHWHRSVLVVLGASHSKASLSMPTMQYMDGRQSCADHEHVLSTAVDKLEELLNEDPQPIEQLRQLAAEFGEAGSFFGVGRSLLVLAFMIKAALFKYHPETKFPVTKETIGSFVKVGLMRRALLAAQWTCTAPTRLTQCPSSSWLLGFRLRWPRSDALPYSILRDLDCRPRSTPNSRLAHVLAFNQSEFDKQATRVCGKILAFFHVGTWRVNRRPEVPVVTALLGEMLPYWAVRPMQPFDTYHSVLDWVLENYLLDNRGLHLEFGVWQGKSLNMIARRLQALGGGTVYGFDSFRGLPEAWDPWFSKSDGFSASHFRMETLPTVEENARLIVGYYNETLPQFLTGRPSQTGRAGPEALTFLHLDSDLYSSTREVLTSLRSLIRPGCVMVLDDVVNFPNLEDSGFRALAEFLADNTSELHFKIVEVLAAPWIITDGEPFQMPGDVVSTLWGLKDHDVTQHKYIALRFS